MRLRLDTCVVDLDLLEVSRGAEVTSRTPMESRLLLTCLRRTHP